MKEILIRFIKEEDGFQVFESGVLTKGSIIVAILCVTAAISILASEYTKAENEFVGSEDEAYEALQRFTN